MSEVRTDDRIQNPPSSETRPRIKRTYTPEVRQDDRPANPPSPEVRARGSVEEFVGRISSLGATLDEIDAVREHWDEPWDSDWSKDRVVRLSDDELRALIQEGRDEFTTSTMTEDEQAGQEHRAAVLGYRDEAENIVVSGTVDQVLEWVGDDPARAEAVIVAEQTVPDHKVRSTLLAALADVAPTDDEDITIDDDE